MGTILIKGVPDELKQRLQREAKRNRRSMNQQVLLILEQSRLQPIAPVPPPVRLKTLKPFSQSWLRKAVQEGRE